MNIRIPTPADQPALQALWQEAFGDTKEFIQTFFETAFSYNRCFCAVEEDSITAALYWFDCLYQNKPVAYLYAIATAKAYQGQNICHRLMEHTHSSLQTYDYIGTILVPGSTSLFDFYQRMGYKTSCFVKEFRCLAPQVIPPAYSRHHLAQATGAPFRLRPITKAEYATLRRQLLPKDSIIQENICLDFLQTHAKLYAGEDFIMASYTEGEILFVPELLGKCANPQQILSSLGCKEGIFRTPGNEKPFAMYLPLSENNLTLPAYFGLAFD